MKNGFFLLLLLTSLVFVNSCQKELSLENGTGVSEGTLQDDASGDCLPKTVVGTYVIGTALNGATNYIEVQVHVTDPGSYTIYTDTVHGISFKSTGFFSDTGYHTVKLQGSGTPTTAGTHNFIVIYGASGCSIAVTVSSTLASYTLGGSPGACTPVNVSGTYQVDSALTILNSVTITVNVTAVGAYSITTTASNGMTFSGSGTFTTTGTQPVVLAGSGEPVTAGNTTIPVVVGSTSCSFVIPVLPATSNATFTIDCASAVINGTYTANTPLAGSNTVNLNANVTTAGSYNIVGSINGITFTGTGVFPGTGTQPVVLTGTGTPTTEGANTISLTGGTAPCNITVTVLPAAGAATFTVNCGSAVVNGTYTQNVALTAANTVTLTLNVTVAGSYNITTTVNGMTFAGSGNVAVGTQTITLNATGTPTTAGPNTVNINAGTTPCSFTCTVVAAPVGNDYYPRTTNSNWSYEADDVADDSVFRKVIAPTHSALGNTYNIFMATDDASTGFDSSGYIRRAGGSYYEFLDMGSYIGLDNPLWTEYIFLKDNEPANATWTTSNISGTLQGNPITVRLKYTITQKDVTITFPTSTGNMSYPNTIVVEERLEVLLGATWTDATPQIGLFKNYYSRNVGLIKQEYYLPSDLVNPDFKLELRRHLVL